MRIPDPSRRRAITTFNRLGERERILATLFVAGLLAAGCDSSHFTPGPGGAAGLGGSGPGIPFDPGDAGFPGDVAGLAAPESWSGYIESTHFASGSDAVKLQFAVGPDGVVAGTLTLGAGSPPPPATDPNTGYPPGPRYTSPSEIVEGFPYTIAEGKLTGSRLQFAIWTPEVWTGWCALQVPLPSGGWCSEGGIYEEHDDGTCDRIGPDGQRTPVDCGTFNLCTSGICTCNDAGCVAAFKFGRLDFDIALMEAAGTGLGNGATVHLTKDP